MSAALRRHPLWLDRALGDPVRAPGPLGFQTAVELDEREEFPSQAARLLDDLGVCRHFVPASRGGDLRSFEELAWIVRAMARRDVTLAVGHGKTCLGTQPIFLAGDETSQRGVAARVLAREPFSLGLTERENGSDLLATTTRADVASRTVTGEKWLMSNATRARGITVLARTRPGGGPRGFSLLLLDKEELDGTYELLPKIRTHGIRGADISGIRLKSAPYRSEPIGGEGAGLSVLLKTFTITRTLIASVAIGAADSALRIVLDFAATRALYGGTVLQIPHARAVICDVLAEQLVCEAAALAGARVLHTAAEQATFWASVLKYHVPTTVDRAVRELATVLGARHYLREGHASGMFQKIQRDVALLGLFDGSTLVNLYNIAIHGPAIGRTPEGSSLGGAPELLAPLAEFEPRRLAIAARSVCGAEALAHDANARLAGRPGEGVLRPLLERLESDASRVRQQLCEATLRNPFDMTAELVELASRYARLATLALAASVYVHTSQPGNSLFDEGDWLVVAMARESPDCGVAPSILEACRERLLRFMLDAQQRSEPFSLLTDSGGEVTS